MSDRWSLIHNRAEFFVQLDRAITMTKSLQAKNPDWGTLDSYAAQLDAIERWTAHGRKPTFDERKSITVGMSAYRELENTNDLDWDDYKTVLMQLEDYFKYWLSDAGLETFDWDGELVGMTNDFDFSDEP